MTFERINELKQLIEHPENYENYDNRCSQLERALAEVLDDMGLLTQNCDRVMREIDAIRDGRG